jgi:subtilisin family serine protease
MVRVTVYDHTCTPNERAIVCLDPKEEGLKPRRLTFDHARGAYVAEQVMPGCYVLSAEADGLERDERAVTVGPAGLQTLVVLGTGGLPFLYRGETKVPFESHEDLVAVALEPRSAPNVRPLLLARAEELALKPMLVGDQIRQAHVHVFCHNAKDDSERERLHAQLKGIKGVVAVGAVVKLDHDSVSFLTSALVVKFESHVTVAEVRAVAEQHRLKILRDLPQAANAYLFRVPGAATYAVLGIAQELLDNHAVIYAEPNLRATAVDDALHPSDFLYPMQWHLPRIKLPCAWKALQDRVGANAAYGSPDVRIAVVDSGTDVTNLDFVGNLSNGSPKTERVFDFIRMVDRMDRPGSGHGTCTAGVATALPNNADSVSGQSTGVVGAAGNCRLMAIQRPLAGCEVDYSDMYMWVGGFDPHSSRPGFPAPISPGADVITSSYGVFRGMEISGLMKDTFNFLTTYGRGGRGILLFFSVGNGQPPEILDAVDFTCERPWAAYSRTFAVAASSVADDGLTEVHCGYSNYGGAGIIDFCTPTSRTLADAYSPPTEWGVLTTGADKFDPDVPVGSRYLPDAPSYHVVQTSTTAPAAPGDTTLAVTTSAGLAGQCLVVGTPGSGSAEFCHVAGIPDATHLNLTDMLKYDHPTGTTIFSGPTASLSAFSGTSSATPLAAGVGALLLSARPTLTWIQVRDILRSTAVHIDAVNGDAIGIWRDAGSVASDQAGYTGPVYSRWYGFGRIDAMAAVDMTLTFDSADVVVRDNLADNGSVPSTGAFWASPDLWIRNLSPSADGDEALPANYATAGPNQDVIAGQDNYVYVRLRNNGTVASSDFYVRVYLCHWPGTEFIYPTNFVPTTHAGAALPSPLVPGTYLLGEAQHGPLPAGGEDIIHICWPKAAVPPRELIVNSVTMHWHPCVLAEVSPQDGPVPTGPHIWDNNSLAQRNVSIVQTNNNGDFTAALVVGNAHNRKRERIVLTIDRRKVPKTVHLYLASATQIDAGQPDPFGSSATLTPGQLRGHPVHWLPDHEIIKVPLVVHGQFVPLAVGGTVTGQTRPGTYRVQITQIDEDGTSGAAAIDIRVRRQL